MKTLTISCLLLAMLGQWPCCGQSMDEVFRMDFLQQNAAASDQRAVNVYWSSLALSDLEALRNNNGSKMPFYKDPARQLEVLEEVLAEYLELEEMQRGVDAGTPEGRIEWDRLAAKQTELWQDRAFAERAFNSMGVDRCIIHVRKLTKSRMKAMPEAEKLVKLNSALASEGLRRLLQIDAQQARQLDALIESNGNVAATKIDGILDRISRLSMERWERLLALIPDKTASDIRSRFGDPVEWFRYQRKRVWFSGVVEPKTGKCNSTLYHVGKKLEEKLNGRKVDQLSPEELSSIEVMEICPICVALLFQPSIWAELETTDEQMDLRSLWSKNASEIGYCASEEDNSRFRNLLSGELNPEYSCFHSLLPHQRDRLTEMEIQIRCGRSHLGTVGMTHPVVAEVFKFSSTMISSMSDIGDEYLEKERELLDSVDRLRSEHAADLRATLADVLTEEQHVKFIELFGEKLSAIPAIP